jgi:hypothetical protein
MNNENPGLKLTARRPLDSKMLVQESARPLGTNVYFTSEGDNQSSPTAIGGGETFCMTHNIGDPLVQSKIIDFNVAENPTYVYSGCIQYKNVDMVGVQFCVIPQVTTYSLGSDTSFDPYGPIAIPAAPGTGHIDILTEDIKLVEVPRGVDYDDMKPAFWDADYNVTTHKYENIRANPSAAGKFNIFIQEISLGMFVNVILLGDGAITFKSKDITQLGYGMRFKLTFNTTTEDHNWKVASILDLFRLKF